MARQAKKYRETADKHGEKFNCFNCGKAEVLLYLPDNRIYTCDSCRYWSAYNV